MYTYNARVHRIIDGDTSEFAVDLGFRTTIVIKARMWGYDAPERFTEAGKKATEYLHKIMPEGSYVQIETYKDPTDKYGRWIVKIKLDNGIYVHDKMVMEGHVK